MNTRNPWLMGLQWGSWAWLGYINLLTYAGFAADAYIAHTNEAPPHWTSGWMAVDQDMPRAWTWLVAFVLILVGSRWARAAVAAALAAQWAHSWGWGWLWVPMCVPLLPLVVIQVEEPRVVLALLALGRWREALARSGGARAAVVAVAVASLNHVLWRCGDWRGHVYPSM